MSALQPYGDYFWSSGKPVGVGLVDMKAPVSYRVISDPYKKRYSLERYEDGQFACVVYDSNLFDFRILKKQEDASWQREILEERTQSIRSLVRNMEERVILVEEAYFEGDFCKLCHFYSPHGIKVATQKMRLFSLQDGFNGVILYDSQEHPVLIKEYEVDPAAGEFTRLIREVWDFSESRSAESRL
jgi:hypothetical protein